MEFKFYLGVDFSKETIDVYLRSKEEFLVRGKYDNKPKGFKEMAKVLKSVEGFEWTKTLICGEFTGVYANLLLNFSLEKKTNIWLESGLQIKKTLGIVRGSNDQIDAERIADYSVRYQDKVKLWEPARPIIEKLKKLSTIRKQLIKAKDQLQKPIAEAKQFEAKELHKLEKSAKAPVIKEIKKKIKDVDKLIASTIREDKELKELVANITSVTGVGIVTATAIIVTTNEFKKINEAKKFSCYSGIVPYSHSSGTSKKGREKVSHLANKKVKTLLHLCALSAIQCEGEFKEFYERKLAQGKNKMSVINAVRNKIVHRIFAVVRDNRKYEKFYHLSLA